MNTQTISIGVFIDGGYYAKLNDDLNTRLSKRLNIKSLLNYIREIVATDCDNDIRYCQITESHYYRGRYRASVARDKNMLYGERSFEDVLIDNDIVCHYKHLREDGNGQVVEKGIDVWFALEAYEYAMVRKFDYVVLITGDADHEMLVRKLKALDTKVVLLSGDFGRSSMISYLLREEANIYLNLSNEFKENPELIDILCLSKPKIKEE